MYLDLVFEKVLVYFQQYFVEELRVIFVEVIRG